MNDELDKSSDGTIIWTVGEIAFALCCKTGNVMVYIKANDGEAVSVGVVPQVVAETILGYPMAGGGEKVYNAPPTGTTILLKGGPLDGAELEGDPESEVYIQQVVAGRYLFYLKLELDGPHLFQEYVTKLRAEELLGISLDEEE